MSPKTFPEDLLSDDSFVRYIKGTATDEESRRWKRWEERHPDHKMAARQARELARFTGFGGVDAPDPYDELKTLETSIKKDQSGSGKPDNLMKFNPFRRRYGTFVRAAAAAMVLVFASLGYVLQQQHSEREAGEDLVVQSGSEFQTSYGEKATLQLTNGSQIVLNANSHLRYFYTGSRNEGQVMNIHLEGEAWFDIIPAGEEDVSRTYKIHTMHGVVEVLGTTFAVQTSEEGTRAVLEKGTIRVNPEEAEDAEYADGVIMKPGQMVRLRPDIPGVELTDVNTDLYTSWIRDVWLFDQTPLTEVGRRIESVFGVTVKIADPELRQKTLSGSISSKNLSLIAEGISEALDEPVIRQGKTVVIGHR